MTIGIGGAGSKLAVKLDPEATLINVSESELNKVEGGKIRIHASIYASKGEYRGAKKTPDIGQEAYIGLRRKIQEMIRGEKVFCSTGGGTGNGILRGLLEDLSQREKISEEDKTVFLFVLPYAPMESNEFVVNTTNFLTGTMAAAIDSGNTGNIILFSNKMKFEQEIPEDEYNRQMIDSLRLFLDIPERSNQYKLLEEHIDHEDFSSYLAKPYFNHFTSFSYDPSKPFDKQLESNANPLLLPPENMIEAMFLLEVPAGWDSKCFYPILKFFRGKKVAPVYSVIENPNLDKPFITVSMLYSRKPAELVCDYNKISEDNYHAKVEKSIEQYVELEKLSVNMEDDARQVMTKRGGDDGNEILSVLKRLGKI